MDIKMEKTDQDYLTLTKEIVFYLLDNKKLDSEEALAVICNAFVSGCISGNIQQIHAIEGLKMCWDNMEARLNELQKKSH